MRDAPYGIDRQFVRSYSRNMFLRLRVDDNAAWGIIAIGVMW